MTAISIDERTKKMLKAFSLRDHEEKFGTMIRESVKCKDKIVKELIANFETKYSVELEEFKRLWDEGAVESKHSHVAEDFIE